MPATSTAAIARGEMYVRLGSNPAARRPWQVRRNRPDQTYEVVSDHATKEGAERAARPKETPVDVFEALLSEFVYVAEPPVPADSLASWRQRWLAASTGQEG